MTTLAADAAKPPHTAALGGPTPAGMAVTTYVTATPAGVMCLCARGPLLAGAAFAPGMPVTTDPCPPALTAALQWLGDYFAHRDPGPLPPMQPAPTPFGRAVRRQLLQIPPGQTVTYGQLSRLLSHSGTPSSPRAVGQALGANPLAVFVPCHRVTAAHTPGGYRYGLHTKLILLQHELQPPKL